MQQLKVEHKKVKPTNSYQKIVSNEEKIVEQENKREDHGRNIALTRKIFRLVKSDVYYVQSERLDNIYYYVKYNFSGFGYCSCPDQSIRALKCKHIFAIEYAIMKGTLQDIEKLPLGAKRYPTTTVSALTAKSYRDDQYDF